MNQGDGVAGLPEPLADRYRWVRPVDERELADAAHALFVTPAELLEAIDPLLEAGIVELRGQTRVLWVMPAQQAVAHHLAVKAAELTESAAQLGRIAQALPGLAHAPDGGGPSTGDGAIAGEVTERSDVPRMLAGWVGQSWGDINFLRPDQWRLPTESAMARVMDRAVQHGRRVRAIYPARALREAPDVLRIRAAFGEQIRVLPEVDTRLATIGPHHALVPDPLGVTGGRRHVVLRERVLVQVVVRYYDQLWDEASGVPDLDRGEARPDLRRLLLHQLAQGAKDEQIARTLGVSLRTVRRRIAALMTDLGADTRFQMGVEAARRGWM